MQTREETNTDASLRNTPLAVPLATEGNPSKRGCRGICSLAKAYCTAGFQSCLCPLWVRSGHHPFTKPCPLCPRKRTKSGHLEKSALCQYRTLAHPSFDHLTEGALLISGWAGGANGRASLAVPGWSASGSHPLNRVPPPRPQVRYSCQPQHLRISD